MLSNFNELFPQLSNKEQHYFTQQELQYMPYFKQLVSFIPEKQIHNAIKKSKNRFKLLSLKKGTIIYTPNMPSNCGYFLCHGMVTLLIKKNNRQKLQTYPRHILHQPEERIAFLNQNFNIHPTKCQQLLGQFYQQKVFFKYLQFQTICGQGYFGINDMIKNNNRPFLAIAVQDTILLQITRQEFDVSLKQLQLKKQELMIKNILQNVQENNNSEQNSDKQSHSTFYKQISVKLSQFYNYFMIKSYQKDEIIFNQNQLCKSIFFIIKGQIELKKSFKVDIPKKLIKNQNKSKTDKQIEVKVTRLFQKCYLGQAQFFFNSKIRQFTAVALENNTILLKVQPMIFLKIIGQFNTFQRQLIVSAKQKFLIANQNYLKQKNKVTKIFLQQFQNIQNKKKQKIIGNFLQDDNNSKNPFSQSNSNMFQVFSKQGVFYRDTYQKLQGFQIFQSSLANNKRAAIKKYRIQTSSNMLKSTKDQKQQNFVKYPSQHQGKPSLQDHQQFAQYDTKQKLLYSPKKNLNILDFISSAPISPQKQNQKSPTKSQHNNSLSKSKKRKSVDKFHELKKDQTVFKRVLIKNGRFQQDKTTYKSNIIKPIVHPKFDQIIKQCMSRKNQIIRRAIGQKNNQFVKSSYTNTVQSLKNKSLSISKFSNVSLTCKGTEQFKKKLQFLNKHQSRRSDSLSGLRNRIAIQSQTLQACIGVNHPPKSSYQKKRTQQQYFLQDIKNKKFLATFSGSMPQQKYDSGSLPNSGNKISERETVYRKKSLLNNRSTTAFISKKQSPEKLILLNHMMKPITYTSVQF